LVLAGFFPYALLQALPLVLKILAAAGAMIALPVFFSSLLFAQSLRSSTDAAQALGMNLLGAVVGGALANLVMIGGRAVLGGLAIVLYGIAAASLAAHQKSSMLRQAPVCSP
jgi:hypothetical protein